MLLIVLIGLMSTQITQVQLRNEMYIGQKVYEAIPASEFGLESIDHVIQEHNLNTWSETKSIGTPSVIQIKSKRLKWFKSYCASHEIGLSEMIGNLKTAIDKTYETEHSNHYNYSQYNKLEDTYKELRKLRRKHGNIMRLYRKGYSFEGRKLYQVEITERNGKVCPTKKEIIWIDAGVHAREWISIAVGMNVLRTLLDGYGCHKEITQLLRKYRFIFVPVFNPDGYVYSWTTDRLWRKTRSNNTNSTCRGVDPNRNWNVQFGGIGSSSDPCSLIYRGPKAESEPCVATFAKELRRMKKYLKAYFSLHSFLQLLLIPNSYTRILPRSIRNNIEVGMAFRNASRKRHNTDYVFGPASFLLRPSSGVSADYVHDILKLDFAYVVELRDRGKFGFLLPDTEIRPNAEEIWDALIASIKTIEKLSVNSTSALSNNATMKMMEKNTKAYYPHSLKIHV